MCDEDMSKFAKLAKAYKPNMKLNGDYIVQPKLDGVRLITVIDPVNKDVKMYSRNGKSKESLLSNLADIIKDKFNDGNIYREIVLDGELLGYESDGSVKPMRQVMNIFGKNDEYSPDTDTSGLIYHCFDAYIPDYPEMSMSKRLIVLEDIVKVIDNSQFELVPYDLITDPVVENLTISDKYEGLVVMEDCAYPKGKRNNKTLKIKRRQKQLTGVVTDAKFGKGKNENRYSKFEVSIVINGFQTPICWTGSGLTEEEIVRLNTEEHLGLIFDIGFDEQIKKSLRFPVIKSIRYDLSRDDITSVDSYEDLNKPRM